MENISKLVSTLVKLNSEQRQQQHQQQEQEQQRKVVCQDYNKLRSPTVSPGLLLDSLTTRSVCAPLTSA